MRPQLDYNHATDETYIELRDQAQKAMEQYNSLSQKSQNAYKEGDKVEAKEYSNQSKRYLFDARKYNEQAANYVFEKNNLDSDHDELDLHGLFVNESEWIVTKTVYKYVSQRQPILKVIVGKGLHSQNHVAKLKPAIENICNQYNLPHYIDSKNSGVLCIDLRTVQLQNLPQEWSNMSFVDFVDHKPPSAPAQNHYTQQAQPQYNNNQHYNNYSQNNYSQNNYSQNNYSQNNYHQQQNHHQQNSNNSNGSAILIQVVKALIKCFM
ncbi:hypothetical protein FOG50_01828 [Hanseniaspora uvarum]|nr:hypothetical protein FOG50_01828 [Hanseniaspora uvarum]